MVFESPTIAEGILNVERGGSGAKEWGYAAKEVRPGVKEWKGKVEGQGVAWVKMS